MDIIVGEGRRRWSEEEKRALVAEVLASGESVSHVARRHNLNPSMLFCWRKQYAIDPVQANSATFTPVVITSFADTRRVQREDRIKDDRPVMELAFESGARLRIQSSADPELVKAVIEAMTRP